MKVTNLIILIFTLTLLSCSDSNNFPMYEVKGNKKAIFNLEKLDGTILNAQDLHGSYILVNFWATWCKPCIKEMPSLNYLHLKFTNNKNFQVIAINIGQSKSAIKDFIKDNPIDFTILLDERMELVDWNVEAIPSTFLIDNNGNILYRVEGEKDWSSQEFTSFINSVINK